MWKTNSDEANPDGSGTVSPQSRSTASGSSQRVASLGPSLVIRGTLSGQEDLLIEGQVEGEISLRKHSVIVGQKGRVKADIFSKSICVEGEVDGNLFGDEQVTIRRSGRVRGNVTSPRVSLEDGSKFKGAIDMNPPSASPSENEVPKRAATPRRQSSGESPVAASAKNAEGSDTRSGGTR